MSVTSFVERRTKIPCGWTEVVVANSCNLRELCMHVNTVNKAPILLVTSSDHYLHSREIYKIGVRGVDIRTGRVFMASWMH